jgi:hypothetical protein
MEKLRQWKSTAGEYLWYFGGEVKQATSESVRDIVVILKDAKDVTVDVSYDTWNTMLLRPTTAQRQREQPSDDMVYAINNKELQNPNEVIKREEEKY